MITGIERTTGRTTEQVRVGLGFPATGASVKTDRRDALLIKRGVVGSISTTGAFRNGQIVLALRAISANSLLAAEL
jgi:hypothetical protein